MFHFLRFNSKIPITCDSQIQATWNVRNTFHYLTIGSHFSSGRDFTDISVNLHLTLQFYDHFPSSPTTQLHTSTLVDYISLITKMSVVDDDFIRECFARKIKEKDMKANISLINSRIINEDWFHIDDFYRSQKVCLPVS